MTSLKRILVLVTLLSFVFVGVGFAADSSNAINLNTATVNELTQLKGVGEKIAEKIISYRKANGTFKSVNELENVKGIGPKIIADNADRLTVEIKKN